MSLSACRNQVEQPDLTNDKFARIMADLYIADGATSGLGAFQRDSLAQIYYGQVMTIHGITRERYEKNLQLLARDIVRMDAVFKQVETLLKNQPKKPEKPE